jgi:hypothetical protein
LKDDIRPSVGERSGLFHKGHRGARPGACVQSEGRNAGEIVNSPISARFIEGAAPKQQRLSPFEAIQNLLIDRVWLGYSITEARMKTFLGWLDDTPAYAISYGTLDDAVQLVERVIA